MKKSIVSAWLMAALALFQMVLMGGVLQNATFSDLSFALCLEGAMIVVLAVLAFRQFTAQDAAAAGLRAASVIGCYGVALAVMVKAQTPLIQYAIYQYNQPLAENIALATAVLCVKFGLVLAAVYCAATAGIVRAPKVVAAVETAEPAAEETTGDAQ